MKLFSKLLLIPLFLYLLSTVSTVVYADAKSDFEFQYSKYRQNYIEYSILKKDFLENPTLDNQQKAILAAKQTLSTRDLAKGSFAAYLLYLCQEKETNYAPIKPSIDALTQAKNFYLSEAYKSQSIVTAANLAEYTQNYITNTVTHDKSLRSGVVACKISQLVRFQIQSKNSLDFILPKLAKPYSTALQTRITDIQDLGNKINDTINAFTTKFYSEEMLDNIDNESYFTNNSETVKKIQILQLKWIDSLIDIDLNYAHS
ncbi:MAG TPA: hypothetical protein VLH94_03705 [Spirochaetia bacterium]|nr:hypothetical protein [Spirochaetia bacterium]